MLRQIKMLNKLEQMSRRLILRQPESREILQTYARMRNQKMHEAVYSDIAGRFPSSRGYIEKIRETSDPIKSMDEAAEEIQFLRVASLAVNIDGFFEQDVEAESTKEIREVCENIRPILDLYEKGAPLEEKFYADLVCAVKEVSSKRGIKTEETIENQKYFDEALKIAIPTREKAEDLLRKRQQFSKNMVQVSKDLKDFMRKKGKPITEEFEANARLIPTQRAIEAMHQAEWDYQMREFDRIYSD